MHEGAHLVFSDGSLTLRFKKEDQMDARNTMSGMTDFFRHPRQSSAEIHPRNISLSSGAF